MTKGPGNPSPGPDRAERPLGALRGLDDHAVDRKHTMEVGHRVESPPMPAATIAHWSGSASQTSRFHRRFGPRSASILGVKRIRVVAYSASSAGRCPGSRSRAGERLLGEDRVLDVPQRLGRCLKTGSAGETAGGKQDGRPPSASSAPPVQFRDGRAAARFLSGNIISGF